MEICLRNLSCIHQTEAVARTKLWLQEGPDRFLSTGGQVHNVTTKEHIRKDTVTFLIAFCFPEALQTNAGLYAEKMSFHHTAIKRSHDSQLHSRTKSFIHKNTCVFSSRELSAKGGGWVFVAGLGHTATKPQCQSSNTGIWDGGHANLPKRGSASSKELKYFLLFSRLHGYFFQLQKFSVEREMSLFRLPRNQVLQVYPRGKYWVFTYKCFYCIDSDWVTTREASV